MRLFVATLAVFLGGTSILKAPPVQPSGVRSVGSVPFEPAEAQPVGIWACILDAEGLRDFFQSQQATRINGDEPFFVPDGYQSTDVIRTILVDVGSESLPYWNLTFQRVLNASGQRVLQFSAIGFGCDSCILVINRNESSKCARMIVTSSNPLTPPPSGYFSGTFITGGATRDPGVENSPLKLQEAPTSSIGGDVNQKASSGCGLGTLKFNAGILWLLVSLALGCLVLRFYLSKSITGKT